jgi:hypothetical protein
MWWQGQQDDGGTPRDRISLWDVDTEHIEASAADSVDLID